MTGEKQESFKILMFPWLAHGHIFPYLQLSKNLIATHNFTIYLCSTAVNLHYLSKHATASLQLVELHMPSPPELPPHLHTTKNLPSSLIPTLIHNFQESTLSFTQTLQTLTRTLSSSTLSSRGPPRSPLPWGYLASTSLSARLLHLLPPPPPHVWNQRWIPISGNEHAGVRDSPDEEPGSAEYKGADDDYPFGNYRISTDIGLVKSCRCIEEKYVDYLSTLSKKKIVCTGPMIASDADGTTCSKV
ncbi:UDP-glucosyltransferase 29-like [Salvia hispanica]|uniref:UDP-glucosyltransferase 29-like n=1 Tax=Salvia hispanica TaxID=49212 RepID=UPI002009588E|nr:UDP-glucosyltransferase 29-like [Salvia hispanica]